MSSKLQFTFGHPLLLFVIEESFVVGTFETGCLGVVKINLVFAVAFVEIPLVVCAAPSCRFVFENFFEKFVGSLVVLVVGDGGVAVDSAMGLRKVVDDATSGEGEAIDGLFHVPKVFAPFIRRPFWSVLRVDHDLGRFVMFFEGVCCV